MTSLRHEKMTRFMSRCRQRHFEHLNRCCGHRERKPHTKGGVRLPSPAGLCNQGLVQKGQPEARGVPKHTMTYVSYFFKYHFMITDILWTEERHTTLFYILNHKHNLIISQYFLYCIIIFRCEKGEFNGFTAPSVTNGKKYNVRSILFHQKYNLSRILYL